MAIILYFNPRAPCGARRAVAMPIVIPVIISIHAPLAGRDRAVNGDGKICNRFQSTRPLRGATHRASSPAQCAIISIHAPLAGRDLSRAVSPDCSTRFQSTRPLRGATTMPSVMEVPVDFNPRAPCGARHAALLYARGRQRISIHAPLAGRDRTAASARHRMQPFQSTRPLRGATCQPPASSRRPRDFNPRAPCGARPSLHPRIIQCHPQISIHAPLAGRDFFLVVGYLLRSIFQSTRPLRGAT